MSFVTINQKLQLNLESTWILINNLEKLFLENLNVNIVVLYVEILRAWLFILESVLPRVYECERCEKRLSALKDIKIHIEKEHEKEETNLYHMKMNIIIEQKLEKLEKLENKTPGR